eukprot:CAMPEP_0181390124 /NCGR_PEP_ID=MMETSP1106-20121128/25310_1 /TAXON_ID=81844 /ORGANISM="Mantoniella antarctica, Strain SL-175" /LENGTH=58 /DNA_ID=CAMNT_0023510999 /DNA_START=1 /DNA_END=175 /DNA_ORIENTATION=+
MDPAPPSSVSPPMAAAAHHAAAESLAASTSAADTARTWLRDTLTAAMPVPAPGVAGSP